MVTFDHFPQVCSFMFYNKKYGRLYTSALSQLAFLDILTSPKDLRSQICQTNLVINSPFKTVHKTHVHFQVGWCTLDFRNIAWHQPIRPELVISARFRAWNASGGQCMDCGWSVSGTYGTPFQLGWSEWVTLKIRQREVSQHLLVWPPQLSDKEVRVHNKCIPVWCHILLSFRIGQRQLTLSHL